MDHPVLFDEDDAVVERVRLLCLPYPEAAEVLAWGDRLFARAEESS